MRALPANLVQIAGSYAQPTLPAEGRHTAVKGLFDHPPLGQLVQEDRRAGHERAGPCRFAPLPTLRLAPRLSLPWPRPRLPWRNG